MQYNCSHWQFPGDQCQGNDKPKWKDMLYFSIVVQTTTGFGDILPKTPCVRDMVALQMWTCYVLSGNSVDTTGAVVSSMAKKVDDIAKNPIFVTPEA